MSLSSGTTLVSPTGGSSRVSNHPGHSTIHRRGSTHSSLGGTRRRSSVHHAHGGHHSRKSSEGEGGRRALAAGLAMHALDTTSNAKSTAMKRTTSGDSSRPLTRSTKSSRSDTHLPTVSRRQSEQSDGSRASSQSGKQSSGRPRLGDRKKSVESARILSSDGLEAQGDEVDSAEEGWESGDDDQEKAPQKSSGSQKSNGGGAAIDMRRTVSDSTAHVPSKAGSLKAVTEFGLLSNGDHPPALTKRTTGFAGSQHPAPDPELEQLSNLNAHTPHYNNAAHVRPAHQVRHQQSAKSIGISRSSTEAALNDATALDDEKTPRPGSISRNGSGHSLKQSGKENQPSGSAPQQGPERPLQPQHMRSTAGSGLPRDMGAGKETSPSFPFPNVMAQGVQSTSPEQLISPMSPKQTRQSKTRHSDPPQADTRRRLASGPAGATEFQAPRLRHRYSNSSLRSIQSLRAPPHPLNSPTGGFRSGLPSSRSGSAFNSPVKGGKRVPSMHQPPMALPVVYRTVAQGEGYAIPEDGEAQPPPSASSSSVNPRGLVEPTGRKGSFSSQQSLRGIIHSNVIKSRVPPSPAHSVASSVRPYTSRRRTALEVASAAAKMSTTSNPVEYHHSLGFSSTLAETSHLISRFLPPKKTRPIEWEITPDNLVEHSGIGLSRGDYRDAHESLIRMMRELKSGTNGSRRTASMSHSYQNLLGTHSTLSSLAQHAAQGLHVSTGEDSASHPPSGVAGSGGARNGVAAAKEGWNGKTPFEQSVDRCVAQRPRRQ